MYYPICLHDVILQKIKEMSKKPTTKDISVSDRIRVINSMIGDTRSRIVPVWLYKYIDNSVKVLLH